MKKTEPLSTQELKPKAAIYIRVSTEEQAKEGFSLSAQEDALKNYADALGYELFKIYKEKGKSAKDIKHRPVLKQLLKDAEEKKFQSIFVYKLDRFSRSLKDLILTIEKLKEQEIDFISLQDKIETASASGKLMFHIISAFAEFERDIISERTRFGMTEKAKKGGTVTKAPIGYKIIDGRLEPDPEKKEQVMQIFNTFLENNISLTQLAKQNNLTTSGMIKLLKNRTYLGEIKFKENYEGKHESIISKEIFDKAQAKLKQISYVTAFKKNIALIGNILIQGDSRYYDYGAEKDLAHFLTNKAIIIEKKEFPEIKEPVGRDIDKIWGPQKTEKYIATFLLKNEGFSDEEIFFERNFGDIPDVVALKKEKEIFVECCSCRISKVISYLEQNRELWVLTRGANPWDKKPLYGYMEWFIFKKGPNWEQVFQVHQKKIEKELRNIPNPFDTLMNEKIAEEEKPAEENKEKGESREEIQSEENKEDNN